MDDANALNLFCKLTEVASVESVLPSSIKISSSAFGGGSELFTTFAVRRRS